MPIWFLITFLVTNPTSHMATWQVPKTNELTLQTLAAGVPLLFESMAACEAAARDASLPRQLRPGTIGGQLAMMCVPGWVADIR